MRYAEVRIIEWMSAMPLNKDGVTGLGLANGKTIVEMEDDEKLHEVHATSTGQPHFTLEVEGPDGETIRQPHTTYAFQATLVRAVPEEYVLAMVEKEEERESKQPKRSIVLPEQANRAERRAAANAKGRPEAGYRPNGK